MSQSVYFTYAFPLDQDRRKVAAMKNLPYPSIAEVQAKTEEWKNLWQEINHDECIMKRLSELTNTLLPYPLEACVFGGLLDPMSRPLLLPMMNFRGETYSKEEFFHICIHEIAHRFISSTDWNPGIRHYWDEIRQRYTSESLNTKNHILIYALLSIVVPEYAGIASWEACKQIARPDYQRAFDLMMEEGAEGCIRSFTKYRQ